ncbi:hypothetical protein [Halioglobus sp. Uisw_031]|uniref:hypothetical protein n=1 Tax=Halioglobus sp. Uisw_031 TaxID=3230977 RepID=UPI0039EC547A
MSIKSLFFKPLDRSINGVVKADQDDDDTVFQELDEYVVTNELEKHFRAFFESYSTDLSDPSIANCVGVWVSGFFGVPADETPSRRKEAVWQVAPWLAVPEGAGQGLPFPSRENGPGSGR